jgi:hypothetical protein
MLVEGYHGSLLWMSANGPGAHNATSRMLFAM